jgi:hypothetical protein
MKKIFNITTLVLLVSALTVVSCKRSFLDVPPQGDLTREQALIDPVAADKLVGGVYCTIPSRNCRTKICDRR